MLDLVVRDGPSPKCYFSSTVLSKFVNHEQIPTKKKPFSTISNQRFSHTVRRYQCRFQRTTKIIRQVYVVLPKDNADLLKQSLVDGVGTLHYAKVYMKLSDLIEGDFFNQYIKSGQG